MTSIDSARRTILRGYRVSAKDRNLVFDLDDTFFISLLDLPCDYCGRVGSNIRRDRSGEIIYRYNGIDRVDAKLGYVYGNVVTCCKDCNFAKKRMTRNEYLEWAKQVYHHLFSSKDTALPDMLNLLLQKSSSLTDSNCQIKGSVDSLS